MQEIKPGPNDGKSKVEIARCLARALMSNLPIPFSVLLSRHLELSKYEADHGFMFDMWVETESPFEPGKKWYMYKGSDGTSESLPELPEGIEAAFKFESKIDVSEGGVVIRTFRQLVAELESEGLQNFSQKIKQLIRRGKGRKEITAQEPINNFKSALKACEYNYSKQRIIDFRKKLKESADVSWINPMNRMLFVSNFLGSFLNELNEQHRMYCVDGALFGNISAVIDILVNCDRSGSDKKQNVKIFSFNLKEDSSNKDEVLVLPLTLVAGKDQKILWPLISDKSSSDPYRILNETAYLAIQAGYEKELAEISYAYQEKVEDNIEEAKNSETIDESLDIIYKTIPLAMSAHIILFQLHQHSKELSESELLRVTSTSNIMEENFTRLSSNTFISQILDLLFNDFDWKINKAQVLKIKQEKGEKEAKRFALNHFVEGHLIYPRALISKLLNED